MTLLHVSVLALGGLLAAIPVVLHLVMRRQPKLLVFPAMQLLFERREANRRRMQLKHWLLLALRCAAIVLLAGALARPSVPGAVVGAWIVNAVLGLLLLFTATALALAILQRAGRTIAVLLGVVATLLAVNLAAMLWRTFRHEAAAGLGDLSAPVAVVLVFDTSPRMLYQHANATRLARARETATSLIEQLPRESEVAVADSATGATVFSVDLGAAGKAVRTVGATNVPRPLPELIADSIRLARTSELARKEIIVFSDLSARAWSDESAGPLRTELETSSDAFVYVVDVGVEKPVNFALTPLKLSRQTLTRGNPLRIQCELTHTGPGDTRTVELHVEKPDPSRPLLVDGKPLLPETIRRDRHTSRLGADGSEVFGFSLAGLASGTHHGTVRIVGGDALAMDDVRYFTVEVRQAHNVLIASGPGAVSEFLAESLAPYDLRIRDEARFHCDLFPADRLGATKLAEYAAICLLDPPPLDPAVWDRMAAFARRGGGVAVFLGRNAKKESFDTDAARQLIPGKLVRQWKSGPDGVFLAPRPAEHPMLARFAPVATSVPWHEFPVFRHWQLGPLGDGAAAVVRFGNGKPAVVEKALGRGRVLTMTTPVSDPAQRRGIAGPWNWLPTGFEPWPFVMLTNEMVLYLVQGGDWRLNYQVGQPAQLGKRSDAEPDRYQLFTPRGDWHEVTARDGLISVPYTDAPGNYRLKGGGDSPVTRGFAANLPGEASDLRRIEPAQLDDILPPDRYRLSRGLVELRQRRAEEVHGHDFYPFLLAVLAIVLGLEHVMANRFYRKED